MREPEDPQIPDVYRAALARDRWLVDYFRGPHGIEAVWLSAPLFVGALLALLAPIRPFDYFWALVNGRALLQLGHVPNANLFLFTLPSEAPFVDQPWLGQLLMYGAVAVCGHAANLVLFALCLTSALAVALHNALRLGARPASAAVAALLATVFIGLGAGVRTQMFAYPCFALTLAALTLGKAPGSTRRLVLLGVTTALWANLHGSFVLAPLLVAIDLAARELHRRFDRRASTGSASKNALTLAVVALATCLNPRGPFIYAYVLHYGSATRVAQQSDVAEWMPLKWSSPLGVLFLCVALCGLGLGLRRLERARLPALFGWISFTLLSLTSRRFLCWWGLTGIVALSPLLTFGGTATEARSPRLNRALLGLFAVITLGALPGMPLFERLTSATHLRYLGYRAFGRETPVRLLDRLVALNFRGRLFHAQAVGGFVEWMLAADRPAPVAFVDQRFEMTPPDLWRDYFSISEAAGNWQALLARYGIDALLIDTDTQPKLAAALGRSREFRLVARESSYRLYLRREAASLGVTAPVRVALRRHAQSRDADPPTRI